MKLTALILTVALTSPASAADKKLDILGFFPGMAADTFKDRLAAPPCTAMPTSANSTARSSRSSDPRTRASGWSAIASRPRSRRGNKSRRLRRNTAPSPARKTSATLARGLSPQSNAVRPLRLQTSSKSSNSGLILGVDLR